MSAFPSAAGPFGEISVVQSSRTVPIGFDVRCAKRLNEVALARRKSPSARYVDGWIKHFRLLRTEDEVAPDVIEAVLNWYITTDWNDEFSIQAFCGASFRRKFERLYVAWQAALKKEDDENLERIRLQEVNSVVNAVEASRRAREQILESLAGEN